MRHPRKAACYAGALIVVAALGSAAPAWEGRPAIRAHHVGGPVELACPPAGPIYYYPTYGPTPPVQIYPIYGPAPPGFYYPAYGPPPPEGRVAPCPHGPAPCVVGPPLGEAVP